MKLSFEMKRLGDNILTAVVYGFVIVMACRIAYKIVVWAFT